MPALVLFGRRWRIGGDDFVFPALWSFIFRIIWLAAVLIVYTSRVSFLDCQGLDLLVTYLIGLLVILSISIVLESIIMYISAQGSIFNVTPRRHLPLFLYIRIVVFLAEIIFSIVGACWVFSDLEFGRSGSCSPSVIHLVQAAVILSWLLLIVVMVAVAILFSPWRGDDDTEQEVDGEPVIDPVVQLRWEQRCKLLCCFAGKDDNSQVAYSEVAGILSKFFQGLDVVPSDIVAGLILLELEQERLLRNGEETKLQRLGGPCLPAPNRTVSEELPQTVHYLKYAASTYGWALVLCQDLCCGICKLCPFCRCCTRGVGAPVEKDNCCDCNTAAIQQVTGLSREDIVYISFHNKIFEIPFFVALDHEYQSVVVTIRGSMSLKDALTDATAESVRLEVEGQEIYAHKGIAQTAMYIRDKLVKEHILEQAFQQAPDYTLIIAGHSLGAGAGALLSILLYNTWPGLKCYAFSPPGGLVSEEGVHFSADFVTTVLLGEDLIPRLGLRTLEDLKNTMIDIAKKSDRPKYQTLLGGFWWTLCGFPKNIRGSSSPSGGGGGAHPTEDPESRQPLIGGQATPKPRPNYTGVPMEGNGGVGVGGASGGANAGGVELYPPGRILWVTEEGSRPTTLRCCRNPSYRLRWATCQDFSHIIISPAMVTDHLPAKLMRALEEIQEMTYELLDSNDHPV